MIKPQSMKVAFPIPISVIRLETVAAQDTHSPHFKFPMLAKDKLHNIETKRSDFLGCHV